MNQYSSNHYLITSLFVLIILQACTNKISKYSLEQLQNLSESQQSRPKVKYFLYLKSARLKSKENQYQAALADFQKALNIRPKHSDVYFYRGILKQKQKNYKAALQDFEQALRFRGGSPAMIYYQSAELKLEMKDYAGALEDCNRATLIYPFFAEAYHLKARIKMKLNYFNGAIQDLKKATRIYRRYPEAYFNLGLCFLKTNQKDIACDFFQKAQEQGYQAASSYIQSNCGS